MANQIVAGNSSNGGTAISTDTSGTLNIVTGSGSGANAITIDASQNVAMTASQTIAGNLTVSGTLTASGGVSGGIRSGTAVASTSGTSIEFTSLPTGIKRITVMFNGVSPSSTGDILIQLGDSGGYETSGYVGRAQRSGSSSTVEVALSSGFAVNTAGGTAVVSGLAFICLLDSTTNTWAANGTLGRSDATAMQSFGGVKSLSATLDRLRLYIDGTQTFDAGSVNILYE